MIQHIYSVKSKEVGHKETSPPSPGPPSPSPSDQRHLRASDQAARDVERRAFCRQEELETRFEAHEDMWTPTAHVGRAWFGSLSCRVSTCRRP